MVIFLLMRFATGRHQGLERLPMTPHDRWLEPDDDDEPEDGLTDAERRQKAFDDFDPPDNDYGGDL